MGPTNRNPWRFSAFESAVDSGVIEATSPSRAGTGRAARSGSNDHTSAASEPRLSCTSRVARALAMVASIFPRWRTMPASASSRSTSVSSKRATCSGSNPANAARNPGRLRRIVSHERPDWKPSRHSFS